MIEMCGEIYKVNLDLHSLQHNDCFGTRGDGNERKFRVAMPTNTSATSRLLSPLREPTSHRSRSPHTLKSHIDSFSTPPPIYGRLQGFYICKMRDGYNM